MIFAYHIILYMYYDEPEAYMKFAYVQDRWREVTFDPIEGTNFLGSPDFPGPCGSGVPSGSYQHTDRLLHPPPPHHALPHHHLRVPATHEGQADPSSPVPTNRHLQIPRMGLGTNPPLGHLQPVSW